MPNKNPEVRAYWIILAIIELCMILGSVAYSLFHDESIKYAIARLMVCLLVGIVLWIIMCVASD